MRHKKRAMEKKESLVDEKRTTRGTPARRGRGKAVDGKENRIKKSDG